jgi:hypothetical protein
MHYDIARQFEPSPRPSVGSLVEACVRAMADHLGERIDGGIITSGDPAAIDGHVRGLTGSFIDAHPERFADLLKMHLLDELVYRVVSRSYLD